MEKHTEYTDLQGNTIKLKDGYFAVTWIAGKGYSIALCLEDTISDVLLPKAENQVVETFKELYNFFNNLDTMFFS